MASSSEPFYGTSGPRNASVALVGEAWGKNEDLTHRPFSGESGSLLTRILADAGIDRDACFITNISPRRPEGNDYTRFFFPIREKQDKLRGLSPRPELRADLARLHLELAAVRPKVVVALGNYPLWALTASDYRVKTEKGYYVPTGISAWRGSQLVYSAPERAAGCDDIPLVPTFHPAAVMRQWSLRPDAVFDLATRVKPIADGRVSAPPTRAFIIAPSFEQVQDALETILALPPGSYVTVDVETRARYIDCLGLAWSPSAAICIPFISVFSGRTYWPLEQELAIRRLLRRCFARADLRWSNQNILYDLQYLANELLDPPIPAVDPMVAQHVMFPGTPKDLTQLASLHCAHFRYWGESKDCKTDAERWTYNCWDCAYTWEICYSVVSALISCGLYEHFCERMAILREVAFDMTLRGIRIDLAERSRLCFGDLMHGGDGGVTAAIAEREAYLRRLMPPHIPPLLVGPTAKSEWISSPKQQAVFFYDLCGCKPHFDKKTKALTVDDDALEKIKLEQSLLAPLVETLQDLRSLGKLYKFLNAKLSPDGRIRSSFNVAGPISFRWSSTEDAFDEGTNLQNIIKEKAS